MVDRFELRAPERVFCLLPRAAVGADGQTVLAQALGSAFPSSEEFFVCGAREVVRDHALQIRHVRELKRAKGQDWSVVTATRVADLPTSVEIPVGVGDRHDLIAVSIKEDRDPSFDSAAEFRVRPTGSGPRVFSAPLPSLRRKAARELLAHHMAVVSLTGDLPAGRAR